MVSCISEEHTEACERKDYCGSAFIWSEIQDAISAVLDKYTIYDLIVREYGLAGGLAHKLQQRCGYCPLFKITMILGNDNIDYHCFFMPWLDGHII